MKWIRRKAYWLVDKFRKTDAAGVFAKIDESQWWPREKLDAHQERLLRDLLIHCKNNVPYYHDLFQSVGIDPENSFKMEDFKRLPVMTKEIIQNNYEQLKAKNIDNFSPRTKTTGGSTGRPLKYIVDFNSHSYHAANNLRAWNSGSGYHIGDRFITVAHGSLLPNKNTFKNRMYFLLQNSLLITSYHLTDKRLKSAIRRINRSSAVFLYGYSSTIFLIAKFAKANQYPIKSSIRAIFTTSDMLYENQRALIEEVFGVTVYDIYGCPEGGLISFECDEHDGYHLNQDSAYVEIESSDSSGFGKILSTSLYDYAFPLLRLDTGDVGKISEGKCNCGRSLPKVSELGGRIRDFVILEDGRYIHGAFFNHFKPFYNNDWIDEYQIIQKDYNHLLIKVSVRRQPTEEDLEIIRKEFHKGLLPDLKIEFDLGGVEYTSGGKFRLIISEVKTKWE